MLFSLILTVAIQFFLVSAIPFPPCATSCHVIPINYRPREHGCLWKNEIFSDSSISCIHQTCTGSDLQTALKAIRQRYPNVDVTRRSPSIGPTNSGSITSKFLVPATTPTPTANSSTSPSPTNRPSKRDNNSDGFKLTMIAVIVVPVVVVLPILLMLYIRWRKRGPTLPISSSTQQLHSWSEPSLYSPVPMADGFGTFQQRLAGGGQWSAPTSPQPPPSAALPYCDNPSFISSPVAGAMWGQRDLGGHFLSQDPYFMRTPSMYPVQHQSSLSTSGQSTPPVEQERVIERRRRTSSLPTNDHQYQANESIDIRSLREMAESGVCSQNTIRENRRSDSGGQLTLGVRTMSQGSSSNSQRSRRRADSGGQLSLGVRSLPQHLNLNSSRGRSTSFPNLRKGEIVLEWSLQEETVPETQMAETSNSPIENPPLESPEMDLLRQRVERLEVALEERGQPLTEVEESDGSPPAYDSIAITDSASGELRPCPTWDVIQGS